MNRKLLARVLNAIETFPELYDPRWYREEHHDGRVTFDLSGLVALVEGATWCTDDLDDGFVYDEKGEPVGVEAWAAKRLGLSGDASLVLRTCDDRTALPYFRALLLTT
ncbi:hypothetical protein [Rhodococcus aetherivorans]|uniref:hypothetical protein n=1 Tax=Rhodococcus aetherivorans TaxID=191292 RepID=UPI00241E94DC|nr:hypothetical protein [Rhodococcus aetherivorans]WFS13805.1 hypothetical protein P9K37_01410 [Rhodococcus aetherivorans]